MTTSASVLARRRRARNVLGLAILSRVSWFAVALVRSVGVDAFPAVATGAFQALFDILLAGLPLETARTVTLELSPGHHLTRASVLTRRGRANVLLLAVSPGVAWTTPALVLLQGFKHAVAVVLARGRIASVLLRDLAQGRRVSDGTLANEAGRTVLQ